MPRCRGAFLEDAQLDTDQNDQNANSPQMIASKEKGIYVLLSSGISEDAARCWARTCARIDRCAARLARPLLSRDSELKGGRFGVLKAEKMEPLPAGSWDKILCSSQASWVMGTGRFDWEGKGVTSVVQPHHQDCKHDIDGNLQVHQNDGAKTGQLGGLVPACPLDFHVDLAHHPRFH